MMIDERLDVGQDGLLFHGQYLSRVITRMSTPDAGEYTKLRAIPRIAIPWGMAGAFDIDVEKLSADMAAHVERTSARKFSLAATGGTNPDFYRNWANNDQNKRLSAKVFMGIVTALGRNPFDYVAGVEPRVDLPNATVLTNTFAMLLDSLGLDPYEDARAQKLAAQFPNALRSIADLHSRATDDPDLPPAEVAHADAEDRSSA